MRPIIAYPGVPGSFSEGAAREAFPEGECRGYATFPEAAEAARIGAADYTLLPIENSFAGAVLPTYALLEGLPLHIVGETLRRVRHQLVGLPGTRVEDIRVISSHPQAIAQCDAFLSTLTDVRLVPSANTAISAKDVAAQGDPTRAAIASEEAAAHYGLAVLRHDIQTSQTNTTRFLILSRNETPLAEPDKATVIFRVNDEVGALVKVLASFAEYGLNMSRIEFPPLARHALSIFLFRRLCRLHGRASSPFRDGRRPPIDGRITVIRGLQAGCAREAAFLKKGPSLALPPGKMTVEILGERPLL